MINVSNIVDKMFVFARCFIYFMFDSGFCTAIDTAPNVVLRCKCIVRYEINKFEHRVLDLLISFLKMKKVFWNDGTGIRGLLFRRHIQWPIYCIVLEEIYVYLH